MNALPPYPHDFVAAVSQEALLDGMTILQGNMLGDTYLLHVAALASYMDLHQGACVLDIGCGFGEVTRLLSTIREDLTFHLVNQNNFQLEHATHKDATLYRGDMHDLPLGEGTVDVAMFLYALCHADKVVALREAFRVVRPGGHLFVYDYERVGGDNEWSANHLCAAFSTTEQVSADAERAGWLPIEPIYPRRDERVWQRFNNSALMRRATRSSAGNLEGAQAVLISTAHQKIVLNLGKPERVLGVIPSAKEFVYKGVKLVAVPHKLDETRVLRNLGFAVPGPIKHHYQWSGTYKPFNAQAETAEFLTLNPRAFCLNDMGTGKTLATLWAYDYLRSIGKATKLLVVSPLSTLERTWGDEIFRHFPHLNFAVLYGAKQRRLRLLTEDVDVYLVNHDGLKVIEQELIKRRDIDVVVVDEVASFRNASTGRWKSLSAVLAGRTYVWGLTGTPTPNAPTDAWAQVRLISPERVSRYYGKFRDAVMKQLTQFKWVARDDATAVVQDAMQPAIRFSREDCIDLPPCTYVDRFAELTADQQAAYREMAAKLATEINEGQILAVNEAVKLSKLVQIACGVVYALDGSEYVIPAKDRLAVVSEVIEQAGGKTIVFVPFKGALGWLSGELEKQGFSVATISGDTPKSARDEIFGSFQKEAEPRVLVAQPAAMAHGLTLTAANTVIWYAPITSNEIYEQANARVTRPGQKRNQLVVNVYGTDVERKIYARLKDKQSSQGLLLDAVRAC